jgi:hypothetical protein
MANAVGPVYTGGFEQTVVIGDSGEEYTILYLPDLNNDQLQKEGKPPVYYWIPGQVRLARKGDTKQFKFMHMHFVGVLDEETHVGVEGKGEVAGGLLSFTITSRYPTSVLKKSEEMLLEKFRGDNNKYWGWRTKAAPHFRIAPIKSNKTAITNLAPGSDGSAPAENLPMPGRNGSARIAEGDGQESRSLISRANLDERVVHGRRSNITNIDAWAWDLQGQGDGSVTGGENGYAGLIGALPSELMWAGFQAGSSPIVVSQRLMIPVWSQLVYLKITGSWDRVFQHFSAHANARYKWFSADIKAELNKLRISGGIKVEMHIDGTIPGAEEMEKEINKRMDMVMEKFMQQASQRIFEPAPPTVEAAQAPSGGILSRVLNIGGGLALKYRRDETKLDLHYEETRYHRYLQTEVISGSFEGIYDEIQNDPKAKDRYFVRVVLGDLSRKIKPIIKPVVNWPDPAKAWVGEPVAFLSAEIGYPDTRGAIDWRPRVFQSTDTNDQTNWRPELVRRNKNEVSNPPANWEPDKFFIRRRVHLNEPMGATDNRYIRVDVEKNVINLDGEGGVLTNENVLEVRADSAGKLEVGPIDIDVMLQDASQVVTVEFQALGKKDNGAERGPVRFDWNHSDMEQQRYWEIFTGQLDFIPRYRYRVHVTVKGTLFSQGTSWVGPWVEGAGNGPLMVHVPRPDEEGVTKRDLTAREIMGLPEPEQETASRPPGVPAQEQDQPIATPPGGRMVPERTDRLVDGFSLENPAMKEAPSEFSNGKYTY